MPGNAYLRSDHETNSFGRWRSHRVSDTETHYVRSDHDKARREALRLKIQRWIDCGPCADSTLDLLSETLAYLREQDDE